MNVIKFKIYTLCTFLGTLFLLIFPLYSNAFTIVLETTNHTGEYVFGCLNDDRWYSINNQTTNEWVDASGNFLEVGNVFPPPFEECPNISQSGNPISFEGIAEGQIQIQEWDNAGNEMTSVYFSKITEQPVNTTTTVEVASNEKTKEDIAILTILGFLIVFGGSFFLIQKIL